MKNLNNITFGEFVDIEFILNNKNDNYLLDVCKYLFEDNVELIKLNLLIKAMDDYYEFRGNIYKNYSKLFGNEEEESREANDKMLEKYGVNDDAFNLFDEDEEESKDEGVWGWYRIANNLANNDILKINDIFNLPLLQVLNHLNFKLNNK